MSGNGDDDTGSDPAHDEAGGQPHSGQQGGQPQGGPQAGGQPQGGPQAGQGGHGQGQGGHGQGAGQQPGGVQPQGGPAQGGGGGPAQGGQAQAQTGPSIADKLQRPLVMDQIKVTLGLYAVIGIGLGFAGLLMGAVASAGEDVVLMTATIGGALGIGPLLAVLMGLRVVDILEVDRATQAAALALSAYVGFFVMAFVTTLLAVAGVSSTSIDFAEFILPILLGGLGSAGVGAAVPFVHDALTGP